MKKNQTNLSLASSQGFLKPSVVIDFFGIKKGDTVADFGCGPGAFTIPVAKLVGEGGKVFAVDIQKHMIDIMMGAAEKEEISNIISILGNIESLRGTGIKDETCDMVLLSNVLFQTTDHVELFEEAKRVLKKGGRLVIIEWKKESGLGPAMESRISPLYIKKLTEDIGLKFDKEIASGAYHYGLIYKK